MKKFPDYVWMIDPTDRGGRRVALRRTGDSDYYRVAGHWSVGSKWKGGKLMSVSPIDSINKKELVECTKAEWKEDNGQYAK